MRIGKRLVGTWFGVAVALISLVVCAHGHADVVPIGAPGVLDMPDTAYRLTRDIVAEGTAFVIGANGITLDLNGHTVRYGEGGRVDIPNPGFEEGDGLTPGHWLCDPGVVRATDRAFTSMGYAGSHSLKFDQPQAPKQARSASVTLSPGLRYIASAWVLSTMGPDSYVYLEVEGLEDSRVSTTARRDSFICLTKVIPAQAAPTQVRLVVGVEGPGLAPNTGSAWVDNVDLKPYRTYGVDNNYKSGFRLTNGTITQGDGGGWESHAVTLNGIGCEVDHITSTVYGVDTANIRGYWGGQFHIHNNVLTNDSRVVLNRHQGMDVISVVNNSGNTSIHDNVIYGGPQFGIRVKAWAPGGASPAGYRIHGNEIHADGGVPNAYGIAMLGGSDIEIYDNLIVPRDSGRGILLEGCDGALVYDNHIEIRERRTDESTWANGVRCRYGARNSRVFNNTIIARASKGYTTAIAVRVTDEAGMNNRFYGNRIVATSDTDSLDAFAVEIYEGSLESGVLFENNLIESNRCNVNFMYGGGARFSRNTLRRLPGELPYRTLGLRTWGRDVTGNIFVDTLLEDGASFDSAVFAGPAADLRSFIVAWSVRIVVLDSDGIPVEGASISAVDALGRAALDTQTSPNGDVWLELTQYKAFSATDRDVSEPYNITVNAEGYPDAYFRLPVHEPTQVVLRLGSEDPPEITPMESGPALAISKTVNRPSAAPGEIVTYTISYRNAGPETLTSVVLRDVIPPSLDYEPGSTTLNGSPVTPDPVSDGVLMLDLGAVEPGGAGQIAFRASVR